MLRAYGGGKFFGEPWGEGPVRVVWLHGWSRSIQDFSACASLLAARGFASVALDLPGFGSSPLPTVAGGARMYSELVAPILEEIASGPVVLVGHSFGGRVATVLAATRPELVSALVLTGVPLVKLARVAPVPRAFLVTRRLHALGLVSDARMEAARQRFGSTDYRNAHGVMRAVLVAMVNESYEAELRQLELPVTMLWGAHDREASPEVAAAASALLTCPHELRIEATLGHMVPTEAPELLVGAVIEALA